MRAHPAHNSPPANCPAGEERWGEDGPRHRLAPMIEQWRYEPEEPKWKHAWEHDRAGFQTVHGVPVGKCPNSVSNAEAERWLAEAWPWSPSNWPRSYPQRMYYVHESGVLYRATPTNPGRSYHGFPEHPDLFPRGAATLKRDLLAVATEKGCEDELRDWMDW